MLQSIARTSGNMRMAALPYSELDGMIKWLILLLSRCVIVDSTRRGKSMRVSVHKPR